MLTVQLFVWVIGAQITYGLAIFLWFVKVFFKVLALAY